MIFSFLFFSYKLIQCDKVQEWSLCQYKYINKVTLFIKFLYSEKATKLCEISTNYSLTTLTKFYSILTPSHPQELLTAEDFWFFCDLYLQFIASINLWNKSIDLRLFLKCKEGPFLRPLRSKDIGCWVLRLQSWNF